MTDISADDTFQIRAFLARTRPLSGCSFGDDDTFWTGRGLIEELALSRETGTTLQWSLEQCADVLRFIHSVEPTKGNCFCDDDSEISATCGFHVILEFIEDQLRKENTAPVNACLEVPMAKVVNHPMADDPEALYPGVAEVDRAGVALAVEMLLQLENWETDEHGIELCGYACLEDWPRQGRPFRNIVAEYLTAARKEGPEVEAGFCAALTDMVGLLCSGIVPDSERYSAAPFTRSAIA
jgi:hypothetical protein